MTDNQYIEHTKSILKNIADFLATNSKMAVWEILNALPSLIEDDEFVKCIATGNGKDLKIRERTVYEIERRI